MGDWSVTLNGVTVGGCDDPDSLGTLSFPPEGMGLPAIRTNDVTYPQRDGVRHFSDWYESRIITLDEVTVCADDCPECPSARIKVQQILKAWSRQCDDIELVVRTDCDEGDSLDRTNLMPTPSGNPEWETDPPASPGSWIIGGGSRRILTYPPVTVPGIDQPLNSIRYELGDGPETVTTLSAATFFSTEEEESLTFSAWIRSSLPTRLQAPGFGVRPDVTGPYTDVTSWTRVTLQASSFFFTPQYVIQLEIETDPASPPVTGDFLEIGAVLAEADGSETATYFDGSTPDSGETIHSWSGEPYNAPSVEGPDRSVIGPFGIVGRPRVAEAVWSRGPAKCATLLLRFDAADQRMYVLDADGTPGSGVSTVTVNPVTSGKCRSYPRCYPMCYDNDSGNDPGNSVAEVLGTECTNPIICFHGRLTNPVLDNVTTGDSVGFNGTITAEQPPVCIDTEEGTAEQGGANRTHLITGNAQMALEPGQNELRLRSFSSSDDGYVTVEYRGIVISA